MRKKSLCLLFLAGLLLLTGCSGAPLPEGMEEDAVLDRGREIVQQLNEGRWQDVYDEMRADGQETTSPAEIQSYVEEVLAKTGAYGQETDQLATGQTLQDTGEAYATAVFYVKHEKDDVLYRIALSTELELLGFQMGAR